MKQLYILILTLLVSVTSFGQVVISQVYGGGGNSGAPYKNDFIELYNRGSVSVDLSTYSVQYASTSGTSWSNKINLTGNILPGKYYLIQGFSQASVGSDLPTPDIISNINLSGTNGKVALVNSTDEITSGTSCPTIPTFNIVDFVGFGSANCSETSPTPALSNTTAAIRKNDGNTDTDNNLNDFTVGAPSPRNSSYTLGIGKDEITNFSLYPNPVKGGKVFINSANNYAERTVQVFDVLGKQLVNQKGSQASVDVSHLNKGVYIIKVAEEGKVATRKLVIE